jgi:hypothetical protein
VAVSVCVTTKVVAVPVCGYVTMFDFKNKIIIVILLMKMLYECLLLIIGIHLGQEYKNIPNIRFYLIVLFDNINKKNNKDKNFIDKTLEYIKKQIV